jgi:diguanylate cyclase (GGDEF)-like protein/PAS domain S-box-containing protein
LEHIAQFAPNSIRMILTDSADITAIIDSFNRGSVNKFLVKPVEPENIRATVKTALESFELTRKNQLLMTQYLDLRASLEHKVNERVSELTIKHQKLEALNFRLKYQASVIDKNVFIIMIDLNGRIVYGSDAFCVVSGYSKSELLQLPFNKIYHPDVFEIFQDLWDTTRKGKVWEGEILNRNKSGESFWLSLIATPVFDNKKQHIGCTLICEGIKDKRLVVQLSIIDKLTQLYNRRYFSFILPKEIQRAAREQWLISFLIFDIDHFKRFNDTYGRDKGDEVLKTVGQVLINHCKRASDISFRLSGQEFGVIFSNLNHEQAFMFANKIRLAIEESKIEHLFNSASEYLTVSLGLVTLVAHAQLQADDFYNRALEALQQAKNNGKNRVIHRL